MRVIIEKREIVGTLKTPLGNYSLLGIQSPFRIRVGDLNMFDIVDDEGFANTIITNSDFIIVGHMVPEYMDVKRVLTEEEQPAELITHATID